MIAFASGSAATLTFNLIDEDGAPIDAQSVTHQLFDKDNAPLSLDAPVASFVVGDTSVTVTIQGTDNTLAQGGATDVRKVSLKIATLLGGIIILDQIYIIRGVNELAFMVGSYQTIQEAELKAFDLSNIDSFNSASQSEKIAALKEAFDHLGMMTYSVDYNYQGGTVDYVTEFNTGASGSSSSLQSRRSTIINKLNLLPLNYVAMLPAIFIIKLKIAQIIEANFILDGDSDNRNSGMVSEKVGESTTVWRQGKALSLPVSRRALLSLTGYIHFGAHIGRG